MIRIARPDGWILVEHQNHARLAGEFARHWRNANFAPPEPFDHVVTAVARHDDAWGERDAAPRLLPNGEPAAFSRELVGTYSAFENIDFADYLRVRGRATEEVAGDDPYAAILVSMHTVNLLTEQANLEGLSASDRALHGAFIRGQVQRQEELASSLRQKPGWREHIEPARLRRAFEFLQACDSLSLIACVRYSARMALRHRHPRCDDSLVVLQCGPAGEATFRVTPWPFDARALEFAVPSRMLSQARFASSEKLRHAYRIAPVQSLPVKLVA